MAGTDLLHPPAGKGPGYETRDVDIKRVGCLALGIVALSVGAVVAMYFLFAHLAEREAKGQPRSLSLVPRDANPEPPAPRLQNNPVVDLKALRRVEAEKADTYHWIDRPNGRVAIPVAQAMELLLARGLPVRQPRRSAPAQAPVEPVLPDTAPRPAPAAAAPPESGAR